MKCLESLKQGLPFELVLFANGLPLSESFQKYLATYPGPVQVGSSDVQLSPGSARNKGLVMTTGEWVHFIDDDSYWTPGYWETVKDLLPDPHYEVIGGPDGPAHPMSYFQESISIALSSPLCTGVTFARHKSLGRTIVPATEEKLTSCNLWIRKDILKENPFPSDFKRAEENFLLQELERDHRRMFYHPKLKVGHFRRKNLMGILRPTLGAGFWRSRLLKGHKGTGGIFWLPSVFVILHLVVLFDLLLFLELAKVYSVMIIFVSMGLSSRKNRFFHFPLVAFLHYLIVFLYGTGFLLERVGYKWK